MARLWWILLCFGCTTALSEDEATESRPIDTTDDAILLKAGVVRCTPQQVTGYQSGTPAPITVVEIDGRAVEVATANAYAQMQAAALGDGIALRVVSGFRSQAEQQYLYGCYVNCDCNQCNLAAQPGYSNHQSGLALDLNTEAPGVLGWLNQNAKRFGFARTVPSEDWHWEYFGGVTGGPCDPSGAPRQAPLRFVGFAAGRQYTNGQWLKVESDRVSAHHVEYRVDGYPVGVSEDRQNGFPVRLVVHQLGKRTLQAVGYDALHRQIAAGELPVEFVAGEAPRDRLTFEGLEDGGWHRNGRLRLAIAERPAGTAAVEYGVGPYPLGVADAADGFAVRVSLNTQGYRAFHAHALDTTGAVLASGSVLLRVLPGADGQVAPGLVFISPEAGAERSREVVIKLAGSDSVARVTLEADGWPLGAARLDDGLWRLDWRFNQTGVRTLRALALDAGGAKIAEAEVEFTVR